MIPEGYRTYEQFVDDFKSLDEDSCEIFYKYRYRIDGESYSTDITNCISQKIILVNIETGKELTLQFSDILTGVQIGTITILQR